MHPTHGPHSSAARRGLTGLALFAAGVAVGSFALPAQGVGRQQVAASAPAPAERPTRYLEATVYLPLDDNRGRPFSAGEWDAALEGLIARFGGATLDRPLEGYWLDHAGRIQRDRVRPLIVSFPPHRLAEFRESLDALGRRLGQEALYVRYGEPNVEITPVGR
jgi:hypothetical protein